MISITDGPNDAQNGNPREGNDPEDDQAEGGSITSSELPGAGQHWTDNSGGH